MDFGALDGLVVSSENNNNNTLISGYDLDFNPKWCGSFKQERSVSATATATDDEWRDLKVAKISQDDFSKAMLLQHQKSNGSSVYSDSQNMLSFSSPNTHAATLPSYARNTTGYGSGGSMRGVIAGVRGPFTPSQWIELEHQALIYKYITVNAPIPSNLLIPIRKALEVAAFSAYPGPHLRHNAYGWGAFHLGFSNNPDPEPGRCRRTDGKKWRCSRDAVADQKYCERHMNRGRHRSRKPVEGQSGHSATTTTTIAGAGKLSASPAAAVTTTSTIVSHLNHHQLTTTTNPAASPHDNKSFLNKADIGSEKIQLSVPVLARTEFGLVCSDSLLNPLQKNENGCQKSQNSLRQFMDDWPRSDRSQLSNSPPINERLNLSPLRMGLGVGNNNSNNNNNNSFSERQQANWIPVSWENSMGGPLGEVLHHSTNNSPSALNLMTEGWENSTQMSPTGVLQKTAFGSVSNSSTGSSPRADCNLVGSSTIMSSSLPY